MDVIASKRYAQAMFDLSIERNQLEEYHSATETLLKILEDDNNFSEILSHPAINKDEKLSLLQKTLANQVPDDFIGLIFLLLKRGREGILKELINQFKVLYLDYKKIANAKVYSARELPEEKVAEIRNLVSKKLGKAVIIDNIIDSELIAGFKVEVEGYLFDASVKTRMNELKEQLLAVNI